MASTMGAAPLGALGDGANLVAANAASIAVLTMPAPRPMRTRRRCCASGGMFAERSLDVGTRTERLPVPTSNGSVAE